MFKIGDLIIYGNNGVCKITKISVQDIGIGEKNYYTLKPVYSSEIIHIPVDSPVFMRSVITEAQALELIRKMPSITGNIVYEKNSVLTNHYQSVLQTHDCKDLVMLIKTIYQKNQNALEIGKKLGQIDQRFMKRAEDLLYGELSIALNIPKEEVPQFIDEMIAANALKQENLA